MEINLNYISYENTKNIHLPSLEIYTPFQVSINYQRPLYESMVHISSSINAVKYLREFIKNKSIDHKEYFWIMLLNNANRLLVFSELGCGSSSYVAINVKEIFQLALLTSADSILCFHNHPSGQLKVSEGDKKITARIKKMADVLSFRFLDHIIITTESHYSFANDDQMN